MSNFRSTTRTWLPVLIWMLVIFSASGDTQSAYHSSRILEPLLRWLFPHIQHHRLWEIILFARKCAHLTEYAVFAVLIWRAVRSLSAPNTGWSWRVARNAWFCVVAYAMSDELHQHFVATRQASIWDVVIDSMGGVLGLLLLYAFGRWRKWWPIQPPTQATTPPP